MKWKFKAHIHRAKNKQFYSTLVARNGEIAYTGETRTRKIGGKENHQQPLPRRGDC